MDKEVSMASRTDAYRFACQSHASVPAVIELRIDVVYADRNVMDALAAPFQEAADDRLRG